MRFTRKAPCGDCPFLRSKRRINLRPERVEEIAGIMLDRDDRRTFTCHADVHAKKRIKKIDQEHCVGALIFSQKNDSMNQILRIAMRLGIYDPDALGDPAVRDRVFDTLDEMMKAHAEFEP
jgi:hypothetical protein